MAGQVVILNGAPRSGKSSIAAVICASFPGHWINLGVDAWIARLAPELRPGLGLRPGGERPDLEPAVRQQYATLYDGIAAESRSGTNVVVDVGHHDGYSQPLGILQDCARRLAGLPVLFVGVRCAIATIMARRNAGAGGYVKGTLDDPMPLPVRLWQDAVHAHGLYDLEVDTSRLSPAACAAAIRAALDEGPQKQAAFRHIAERP